jgi:hypothetical protein
VTSCARVNGKPIDREKQIKYDIAKNEDGPLTRTAVKKPLLADSSVASTSIVVPEDVSSTSRVETPALGQPPRKKRRLGDVEEESAKSTANARTLSKDKRKVKEQQPTSVPISSPSDQAGNETLSTKFMADMDERMLNIEEHLAVRYGNSPPPFPLAPLFSEKNEILTFFVFVWVHVYFSTFFTKNTTRPTQISGRSHHQTREGVPALGGFAFQSAKSRGNFFALFWKKKH